MLHILTIKYVAGLIYPKEVPDNSSALTEEIILVACTYVRTNYNSKDHRNNVVSLDCNEQEVTISQLHKILNHD